MHVVKVNNQVEGGMLEWRLWAHTVYNEVEESQQIMRNQMGGEKSGDLQTTNYLSLYTKDLVAD